MVSALKTLALLCNMKLYSNAMFLVLGQLDDLIDTLIAVFFMFKLCSNLMFEDINSTFKKSLTVRTRCL